MLCGVCTGIAAYFDIDPTLVRLGWVLFGLLGGSGLLAYIICAIVIPEDPDVLLAAAEGNALIFATDGGAAEACLRISRRLCGEMLPLMKL